MTKKTLTSVVVAIVLGAMVAPAAPAAQTAELAGTTTVSATRTSVMAVTIPQPVRMAAKPFDNPFAKFSATGQFAGVVLQQMEGKDPLEAMAFSLDPCGKAACKQRRLEFFSVVNGGGNRRVTLPAGPYWLYVTTDETPVEVELSLPGLGGSTTLAPSTKARSTFSDLDPAPLGDSAGVVYSASGSHSIERLGLSLVALEVESDAHLAGEYGACIQRMDEEVPPAVYRGSCGGWTFITPSGDPGRALVVGLSLVGEGSYAHSVSHRSAALVTAARSFGFSLDYQSGKGSDRMMSTVFSFESS
jgi:hypothetical protein